MAIFYLLIKIPALHARNTANNAKIKVNAQNVQLYIIWMSSIIASNA